jgi:hypothetical protein
MDELGDKIVIYGINRLTGEPNRSGDMFRVMFVDNQHQRHTVYCSDVSELLENIKEIVTERMNDVCKT